ncbi:hypothetical protein TNIN_283521 [Trichonephila inaurata madagascariensis]|uniref:Uncharacterized protein n=1 Tax=Trichonephila inaurata madagascariensis TaxID=2747483 RepID=A0A8X6Y2R9_9ARAC|nr:hypothetical protein TNIN_283521 [Trichonephila inaurata madagascariensis]
MIDGLWMQELIVVDGTVVWMNASSAETLRTLRGTTIKVHEDHLWAVLLVTPLMKRNHHLSSSKEIIFINSTSSLSTEVFMSDDSSTEKGALAAQPPKSYFFCSLN